MGRTELQEPHADDEFGARYRPHNRIQDKGHHIHAANPQRLPHEKANRSR